MSKSEAKKSEEIETNDKYHYTECGLDNIYIEGLHFDYDDHDELVIIVPNIQELHWRIATTILLENRNVLNGKEVRFLRTEMGLTAEALARELKTEQSLIEGWEENSYTGDLSQADSMLRELALSELVLDRLKRNKGTDQSPDISIRVDVEAGTYHPLHQAA